ncbi:dTDP-4-dehydrorhamnose 3,5-epimerase [Candidatus Aerophobetes bacterium]|uniref:dTDP-4-dehydrorhamnose 3,5-epimerase n=1 Tax=Aerophobetes bacterium TaxID=2030807 RepID=A0A2A4X597_UNCAE|nr:MAG: dTDP-4-dehydrorhamnose 3,5-epimerase [Candidatus Aerophobetes bacterium]
MKQETQVAITRVPILLKLKKYADNRGFFVETFSKELQKQLDLSSSHFVQDNHSYSKKGVLRGMHYQTSPGQDKLVYTLEGEIYDVVVDIRADSPNFGKWQGFHLDSKRGDILFVPHGFAHGFLVLSGHAHVTYKVSSFYSASGEKSFDPLDKTVNIDWPLKEVLLSERDQQAPSWHQAEKL